MNRTALVTALALSVVSTFPAFAADTLGQNAEKIHGESLDVSMKKNVVAWEWPWSTSKNPYCFAVSVPGDYIFKTLQGENRADARSKAPRHDGYSPEFFHNGQCQCEGKSAIDQNESCKEPQESK